MIHLDIIDFLILRGTYSLEISVIGAVFTAATAVRKLADNGEIPNFWFYTLIYTFLKSWSGRLSIAIYGLFHYV